MLFGADVAARAMTFLSGGADRGDGRPFPEPVSYTHLDVYKRQDPGGLDALCEALRREHRLASVEIVQGGSRSNLATRPEDSAEPVKQGGGSELARAQAARMRAGKPVGVPVRIPIERVSENLSLIHI